MPKLNTDSQHEYSTDSSYHETMKRHITHGVDQPVKESQVSLFHQQCQIVESEQFDVGNAVLVCRIIQPCFSIRERLI